MKNIFQVIISIVFIFLTTESLKANTIANTQIISYKIATKSGTNNCYEVSFKSNQTLNAPTVTTDKVSSAQVTIVAPAGTSSQITNLIAASGISFNQTSTLSNFEVNPYPGNSTLEYITFGIKAFDPNVAANTDYLLFSFCLNTCTNLRLINGLSPDSPYFSTYTGTTDTKPTGLDPYNSMTINTGSPLSLYEAYQGTNNNLATCVSPDLTTAITPSSSNGTAGVNFNYSVCVNNIGTGATTGTQSATITLPAGLAYVSGGNGTWTCNSAAGSGGTTLVTCSSSTAIVATNGSSCFPLVVQPASSGTTYTTNVTASVLTGTTESSTSNNASTALLNTGSGPDLTTSLSPNPGAGTVGSNFTYTATVNNIGGSTTTAAASVTYTLPAGLTYVSGGNGTWTCNSSAGSGGTTLVTCSTASNPNIAAGSSTTFPLVVTPTSNTTYTTTGSVTGGGDTNTSNNTTSATLNTGSGPDLTTSLSPNPGAGTVGSNFTYTATVNNIGGSTTTAPTSVTYTLPAGLTYVSGGNGTWTCNSSAGSSGTTLVTCSTASNPNIVSGGNTTFPLVVTPTSSTTYTTTGSITGGGDTNTSNNTTSATLTATTSCNVSAGVLSKN